MIRTLTRWTVADYHQMVESGVLAGRQVELIGGQIIDMAPELPIHRATYRRGVKYLEALLGEHAVVFSAAPVTLPSDSEPQPDISIVRAPESRYNERHPGPGDIYWLIEVANSSLTYDLGEKAQMYARDQIQDYWVLDIRHQKLWVHREPQGTQYQVIEQLTTGPIVPLALPAIEVAVERLLS